MSEPSARCSESPSQGRENGVSTIALRMSSGARLGELVARGIDALRQEIVQTRGLLQEFDWGPVDDEWGRSESVDPDDVGDIADEGMGHRG
jgi:hypothetical protein